MRVCGMSYVHVLVAKDDRLYTMCMHYRAVMRLFEEGPEKLLPCLRHRFLDAGYVVVDLNRGIIVNSQSAFSVGRRLGKRAFDILEA